MKQAQNFEEAVSLSKALTKKPSNDILLKLYAYYKQASEGDVQGTRPGGFDFKGAAKYDAWSKIKGMAAQEAEGAYISLINDLLSKE